MSWAWWTSQPVQNVANAIDFGLGSVGFLGTGAGLVLGYLKLKKVQGAAEAATVAATEAKDRLQVYNSSVDFSSAVTAMKSVIEHLDRGRVVEAVRHYDDARVHYLKGAHGITFADTKIDGQARKLNGVMQKDISVLRSSITPMIDTERLAAVGRATRVRDTIIIVQIHHSRGSA